MEKVRECFVLSALGMDKFNLQITQLVADGYIPFGGVSTVTFSMNTSQGISQEIQFSQLMVKI